jgi:ligand-binding sensor domain-containing protein
VYTSTRTGFRQLVERTLTLPTALASIPFAGVGRDGRVWAGIRIQREDGSGPRSFGAVVLDAASETVLYHHRGADTEGTGLALPDETSAMAFDAEGNAWFATLSGAVRVEAHQAIVFGEARGVRGDVVTDIVAGSGVMWIAAAEGLGSYANREFDFFQPPIVAEHRPTALAADVDGHIWAAGRYGLLQYDGTTWSHFDASSGLPTSELRDVEVDGAGRVWLLTADALLILAR